MLCEESAGLQFGTAGFLFLCVQISQLDLNGPLFIHTQDRKTIWYLRLSP